jgi:uncharacterized protein (TIGR01244 family)
MRTIFVLTLTLALTILAVSAPLSAQSAQTKAGPASSPDADGFGILNATSPAPGILFGGQPTAEQLQALAAAQYKTVIDLRGTSEDRGYDESSAALAAGLDYIPLPVTEETLRRANTLDAFIRIFRESEKPVLVHCGSGGRVATVYYAWLVAEEKRTREEALARAKEEGLSSEKYRSQVDAYLDLKSEQPKK